MAVAGVAGAAALGGACTAKLRRLMAAHQSGAGTAHQWRRRWRQALAAAIIWPAWRRSIAAYQLALKKLKNSEAHRQPACRPRKKAALAASALKAACGGWRGSQRPSAAAGVRLAAAHQQPAALSPSSAAASRTAKRHGQLRLNGGALRPSRSAHARQLALAQH